MEYFAVEMVLESGRARVRLEASPIWCRRSSLAAYSFGGGVKPAGQNTGAWLAVLKFLADTAICPGFRGNIRCRDGNRTSSAVKGRLWQRLATLRLARLRRSRPRFARHSAAPRPLHAALPCGGGRRRSKLADARASGGQVRIFLFINRKLEQRR